MLINTYVQHHFQFLHGMTLNMCHYLFNLPIIVGNLFVRTLSFARNTKLRWPQTKRGIFWLCNKVSGRLSSSVGKVASYQQFWSKTLPTPRLAGGGKAITPQ